MWTFRCQHCPTTYTLSADLLDESQAQCLAQLAGWRVFLPEGSTATVYWCPFCYRARIPWTPPPPRKPRARSR